MVIIGVILGLFAIGEGVHHPHRDATKARSLIVEPRNRMVARMQ
jgi:hypothetical protein